MTILIWLYSPLCHYGVTEKLTRLALIDFLRGLVHFDPKKRWSPWQVTNLCCYSCWCWSTLAIVGSFCDEKIYLCICHCTQASRHPFVTGEPFSCPYEPPSETPRIVSSLLFELVGRSSPLIMCVHLYPFDRLITWSYSDVACGLVKILCSYIILNFHFANPHKSAWQTPYIVSSFIWTVCPDGLHFICFLVFIF